MPTELLNFDQVFSITQQTINTQFQLMTESGDIDKNIDMPCGNGTGFNGTINAPIIDINVPNTVSTQQVTFSLPFSSGKAKYYSPNGNLVTEDLSGWRIAMTVDLAKIDLRTNGDEVKLTNEASKQVQKYLSQSNYSVYAILLDLANVNSGTAQVFDSKGNQVENSSLVTLLSHFLEYLKKDGNPFIVSINKERTPTDTGIDAFKPTGVMFNTHLYDNKQTSSDLNTYNTLIMNQGHPLPYTPVTLPKFGENLVPAEPGVNGRLYISKGQFSKGYVEPIVLPVVRKAMSFVPSSAQFSTGDSKWVLNYELDNSSENDGHGGFLGEKKFEKSILGKHITFATFKLYQASIVKYCLDLKCEPNGSLSLKSQNSSVLYEKRTYFLHGDIFDAAGGWAKIGFAEASLPFSFDVNFEAGANGKFTVSPHIEAEEMVKSSDQHFPGWVPSGIMSKVEEWVFDLIHQTSVKDLLNDMAIRLSNDLSQSFDGMHDFASESLEALGDVVVLPAANSYFFKNAGIDAQGNVYFDTAVKS